MIYRRGYYGLWSRPITIKLLIDNLKSSFKPIFDHFLLINLCDLSVKNQWRVFTPLQGKYSQKSFAIYNRIYQQDEGYETKSFI